MKNDPGVQRIAVENGPLKRKKIRLFAAESLNLTTESGSILCVPKAIILQGRDVGNCPDDSSVMADKGKTKTKFLFV